MLSAAEPSGSLFCSIQSRKLTLFTVIFLTNFLKLGYKDVHLLYPCSKTKQSQNIILLEN